MRKYSNSSKINDVRKINQCHGKATKFFFSKNSKVAGTTVSTILIQIASHYRNQQIHNFKSEKPQLNVGYMLSHYLLNNLTYAKKLFPKSKSIWFSTSRSPEQQFQSSMKYFQTQNYFSANNFDKTYKIYIESAIEKKYDPPVYLRPILNTGSKFTLSSCAYTITFNEFTECAEKVISNFDFIVPVEYIERGLIILHKLTCLPLSDFAFIRKKTSQGFLNLSQENKTTILKELKRDDWFYNYTKKKFENFFSIFQRQFCVSANCSVEVETLKQESAKLWKTCNFTWKTRSSGSKKLFSANWKFLLNDVAILLRCISFSIQDDSTEFFQILNNLVLQHNITDNLRQSLLAERWSKLIQKKGNFF